MWKKVSTFVFLALFLIPFSSRADRTSVVFLEIQGTIHIGTALLVDEALRRAKDEKAEAVLIQLDTPGGLLDSTRSIVKSFLNSEVPILLLVGPSGSRAGSAGTFLTLAAHVAAMAPGTNIGAAHPVTIGGKDPEAEGGKHLAKKIENDTIAFIENIARQRNRNQEWAKKAVLESDSISDQKALELNVIDLIAKDPTDFLEKADGRKITLPKGEHVLRTKDATLVTLKVDWITSLKNFLAHPTVIFILILIAGLGIYIEFSHPGLLIPGIVGVISLLLVAFTTTTFPVSMIGVALIVIAFAMLVAEIYTPGFGLWSIGGAISFVIGSFLLFDPKETDLRVPNELILSSGAALLAIGLILAWAIAKIMRQRPVSGKESFAGRVGIAEENLLPEKIGRIFIDGEFWNAQSYEFIPKGSKVTIEKTEGLLAYVRPIEKKKEAAQSEENQK